MHVGYRSSAVARGGKAMKDELADLTKAFMAGENAVPARKPSQAQMLVDLASGVRLFHSPDQDGYARVIVADHSETWPLRGKIFKRWLTGEFYKQFGKPPHSQALQQAIAVLEARAHFDSPEHDLYIRVGEHDGRIYVDLCDEQRRAVEIDQEGWRIISDPPIQFRRTKGMRPLLAPAPGGSITQLRQFLNVGSDTNWMLCLIWIITAYRPRGPYPILILQGEQGSAKSTTAKLLRRLIDPSVSPVRTIPKDERDLMIASSNSHVIAYDNLSGIQPWLSDALCRLATGGGFSTRELYSDSDEVFFNAMRPVILNGIDHLAERADLADRSVILNLPVIEESNRRDEADLYADFEQNLPEIIGALFTVISGALARLPHVQLARKPRMADLAVWATAAEEPLGFNSGDFMRAYAGNRAEAVQETLEADPVGAAIIALMANLAENGEAEFWEGTCTELLKKLESIVDEGTKRSSSWPKSPQAMSGRLRRLAAFLRESGIHITLPAKGTKGRRQLTIAKKTVENVATQASEPTHDHSRGGRTAGGDVLVGVAMLPEPAVVSPPEQLSPNLLNGSDKSGGSSQVARVAMISDTFQHSPQTDNCPRCGPVYWQRLGGVLACPNCGQEPPREFGLGASAGV